MTTLYATPPDTYVEHGPRRPPGGWRRLIYPGFLRAAWMAPLFFGIGSGIVVLCRGWCGWHPIWFGSIIVRVAALVAGPSGLPARIGGVDCWGRCGIRDATQR